MVRARSIQHFGASAGHRGYQPGQSQQRSGRTFLQPWTASGEALSLQPRTQSLLSARSKSVSRSRQDNLAPNGAMGLASLRLKARARSPAGGAFSPNSQPYLDPQGAMPRQSVHLAFDRVSD